ncbi:MAG: YqgE/AlgH family protein [Pseudomonadota bacterium]
MVTTGVSCWLSCVFLLISGWAVAESALAPERGRLLVATEQVQGTVFKQSVVLLIAHGAGGAAGVILNQPTEMQLSRILPQYQAPLADRVMYRGGPLQPFNLFMLIRTKRTHPTMSAILDDIYVAAGARAFVHIAGQVTADEKLRVYAGLSGWAPGQLEAEIRRGDWLVVPAAAVDVLSDAPQSLWRQLMKQWSGHWI